MTSHRTRVCIRISVFAPTVSQYGVRLSSYSDCNIDMYRCVGYRRCTGMAEGRQGDAIKSMGLVRLKTSVTMQPAREKRSDGRNNPDTYYVLAMI